MQGGGERNGSHVGTIDESLAPFIYGDTIGTFRSVIFISCKTVFLGNISTIVTSYSFHYVNKISSENI